MLKVNATFSSFSVDDLEKAKKFYSDILGLKVDEDEMGLYLNVVDGARVFVYRKDDHQPATFTILNFDVNDIDAAVEELKSQGVVFEHYAGMTDDDGIARGLENDSGPNIAWFKDPAGNTMSVLENPKA
jgi:predicted enzyme related to lactoylglutathione lyase